ncbi:MAG TPA: CBS domain-containing protein [Thermomicrobiales bacterium]|nr:CBS domain-containing protein [Thermomicrobiales bacterium]
MADDRPDQEQFVIPNTSEITVEQIMRRDVPAIGPDDTVAYVARTMADHRLAGVPVVDDGEVIGIITESDIIQREADIDAPTPVPFLDAIFVADAGALYGDEVRRALAINARMLMSNPVTNIRQSATLSEVATVMIDRHLKVLPVLDDEERLVGIVTRAELVRVIAELENQAS